MTGAGRYVEVQSTAEGRTFSGEEMQTLLELAAGGIRQLRAQQHALLPQNFLRAK
jgi:ribonuclease PH